MGHIGVSIVATLSTAVLVCGIYPAVVWGITRVLFRDQANGSLIYSADGKTVMGSRLIGQNFSDGKYFHPRPSNSTYDATTSGGSNLGPTSDKLINGLTSKDDKGVETLTFDGVRLRVFHYALDNGISFKSNVPYDKFKDAKGNWNDMGLVDAFHDANTPLIFTDFAKEIPGDAVTASASGLDPHISVANALLQAARVAQARGLTEDAVKKLVDANTDGRDLGMLGDPGVNVLMLNLALDKSSAK
ncbi:MAG: potassium-transporting ATPase subunit C [Planctomycetota bacterium]|nr:potassium-transporting ATPase subunit C [Planctomycetota bacterium]